MTRTLRVMPHLPPQIAALSVEITPGQKAVKILPAGEFRARDGRPADCPHWVLDSVNAALLVAQAAARQTRYAFDYEHQTLRAADNGQPAPSAGWFSTLEWREGDGLYATDVEWTARAAAMIDAHEYLYISPLFVYTPDGRVQELINVALTNNPALDELPALSLAALSRLLSPVSHEKKEPTVDLNALLTLLGLPPGTSEEQAKAKLAELSAQAGKVGDLETRVAALSATQVDPAKHVPVDVAQAMQQQIANLTAQVNGRELDELVAAALSDGRLLPAQEKWARDLGASNVAALRGYIETATPIAALSSTQTGGRQPVIETATELTGDALAICSMFGNDPVAIKAAMGGEQ